ncbi:MAG: transglycosylase domain-containing protein [Demequina sp.]|nr:transglycosylase domain-containing protein [Demequina sp.]
MAREPRPRVRVTLVQFATALLMFAVLSVLGGVLVAGMFLPAASVASGAAEESSKLFEELPTDLAPTELAQKSNIYDSSGKHLLATFYTQNRVVVPLEQISPWIQKATVAVEDKRFWQHNGVDGQGIVRAMYINLTSSHSPGGSTLTQQLIKNVLLQKAISSDKSEEEKAADIKSATEVSMTRKIREWRLALGYEEELDRIYGDTCTDDPKVDCGKEYVLEQYLNIAQFGTNTYGVEAAAEVYFGKHASQLNAIEAATIAGITQNPSKWDPLHHPKAAQQRRNVVLFTMFEQGMITKAEYHQWRAMPIENTLDPHQPKHSCAAAAEAPFFCDYVTRIIAKDPVFNQDGLNGQKLLEQGGLTIITTLDYTKQKIANQELNKSMKSTDKSGWAMALVALEPTTGEILAMAQNRTYDPSGKEKGSTTINYSVDRDMGGSRGFSPGSTFKPVVLAAWLKSGRSLMQVINANQKEYKPDSWTASCLGSNPFRGSASWKPGNSEGEAGGQMTVLSATAHSINTGFVAMAHEIDLCDIETTAEDMGFHRADGVDYEVIPSTALGTQNASPLTMSSIAQTLANNGKYCPPTAIVSVTGADGHEYDVPQSKCTRALTADIAAGVTYALEDVMTEGTGKDIQLASGRPSAGKTGTAQMSTHLWFMGYTPQLVATVWMGNPTHDVIGENIRINGTRYPILFGATISGPTWKHFMDRALKGEKIKSFPKVSNDILYGVPRDIPDVVGMTEAEAQKAINEAGFRFAKGEYWVYAPNYVKGTIAAQNPAGGKALPGAVITYYIAASSLPDWWYNWPPNWDPNKAPSNYWGTVWPPPEFATNPPNGWPGVDQPHGDGDGDGHDDGGFGGNGGGFGGGNH